MIDPIPTARKLVKETVELRDDVTVEPYVVWFCYILGGWKALVSTPIEDGRYYEVTYDKAKGCAYVDTYHKEDNEMVYLDEGDL